MKKDGKININITPVVWFMGIVLLINLKVTDIKSVIVAVLLTVIITPLTQMKSNKREDDK